MEEKIILLVEDNEEDVILTERARELPCAKSTGRLNDFIIQTTLAV